MEFDCLKVEVFYNRSAKGYYLYFKGNEHRGFCIAITKEQKDEIKHHLRGNFMPKKGSVKTKNGKGDKQA